MSVVAHNLQSRIASIHRVFPNLVIGTFGDAAHMAEQSDHNLDDCGVCHAIDVMVTAGTTAAKVILAWVLGDPRDLEYVIHDHLIYERLNGWAPQAYTESDPHTNHIHISGKHGGSCWSVRTGVAYDHAAEAMTPAGIAPITAGLIRGDDVSAFIIKGFPGTPGLGTPSSLDGHLHISDGSAVGYHVPQAQSYLGKAFPGAITISASDCPPGWTYQMIVSQLFGPGLTAPTLTEEQITRLADEVVMQMNDVDHTALVNAVRDGLSGATITVTFNVPPAPTTP